MSDDLVERLRKRAEIRRQIDTRKSVQNNEPDRIADLLEESAEFIEHLEKVKDLHRDAHHKCVEISREEYKKVSETIEKYKKVLEEIANDYPELSHDKARMQNLDHIKWAKNVLKMFACNGFCGEYECKANQANCKRIKK